MILDRMQLADIAHPRKLAEAVIRQLGADQSLKTPVSEIGYALGIVAIEELTTEGFEGALITDDAKSSGHILVNRGASPQRRRYSIGHELGHFLIAHHVPQSGSFHCTRSDMMASSSKEPGRPRWEAEANLFAAELLMPKSRYLSLLRTRSLVDLAVIREVAGKLDVSMLACARRFTEIGGDDCAVLVSHEGTITQRYWSVGFPFPAVKVGMHIPHQSLTRSFSGTEDRLSTTDESESSLWIDDPPVGMTCYEQVLVQRSNYRLTLLTCERQDLEAEEAPSWNLGPKRWDD